MRYHSLQKTYPTFGALANDVTSVGLTRVALFLLFPIHRMTIKHEGVASRKGTLRANRRAWNRSITYAYPCSRCHLSLLAKVTPSSSARALASVARGPKKRASTVLPKRLTQRSKCASFTVSCACFS